MQDSNQIGWVGGSHKARTMHQLPAMAMQRAGVMDVLNRRGIVQKWRENQASGWDQGRVN